MNRKFGKTFGCLQLVAGAVALLVVQSARADVLENCTVTNSALCNAVEGARQPGIVANGTLPGLSAWIDDTYNATQINYSNSDPGRTEQAYGSLGAGILRVSAQAYGWTSFDQIAVTSGDFFTILGPSGTVSVTANFIADGTANLPSVSVSSLNPMVSLLAWIAPPGGSYLYAADQFTISYSAYALPNPTYSGPIYSMYTGFNYLDASRTWTQAVGVPFYFSYGLNAEVTDGGLVDALHTGTLGFGLPAGYSIVSAGGFGTAPASTPEPATALLAFPVMAGLVLLRRRRDLRD